MSLFRSFRFRIAGLAVLLSSAVLAVFGASAWKLTERLGVANVDDQLREECRRYANESRRPEFWERYERMLAEGGQGGGVRVLGALFARERESGEVIFKSSNWPREIAAEKIRNPPEPPPAQNQPPQQGLDDRLRHGEFAPPDGPMRGQPENQRIGPPPPVSFGLFATVRTPFGSWRVGTGGSQRMTYVLATRLAPLEANLHQLTRAMIAAAVPGLLLIAAAGGFLAARALRPIARLTATAERINARGLAQRLPASRESAEFQRLTDVFNGMLDRLDKSFQQATRFSADAAHELKTPLTILQGQLEQGLRDAADHSEQQRLCADLLEEVQRLKNIIRKLLLLSLADAGELRLNREPVDFSAVVSGAAEDFQILAPGLRLETDIAAGVGIAADPDLIGQVVQNLVSNAMKYNREDGFVRIELRATPDDVRLTVINSGTPIPVAEQGRVFERFFRADPSRAKTIEGVGLGLSLAREIARAHGGDLALERSDETGTTFELTLPFQRLEKSAP